jgi:hypothetical protein
MPSLLYVVARLPIPTEARLAWQRTLLDRAFAEDIAAARRLRDNEKVKSLEQDHRFQIELHDEDEDAYLTRKLLGTARRLRVPITHRYNEDKTESDHWYEGHYTHGWYLTTKGVAALREEIRRELKARYEARAQWVIWLSALTGVIGAVTGLVALLTHRAP